MWRYGRLHQTKLLGRAWTRWRLGTLCDRLSAEAELAKSAHEAELAKSALLDVSVRNGALGASMVDGMDYVENADPSHRPSKKMMQPLLKWGLLRKMRLQRAFLEWKAEVVQTILQDTLVANHAYVNNLMRRQALVMLNTLATRLQKNGVATFFR